MTYVVTSLRAVAHSDVLQSSAVLIVWAVPDRGMGVPFRPFARSVIPPWYLALTPMLSQLFEVNMFFKHKKCGARLIEYLDEQPIRAMLSKQWRYLNGEHPKSGSLLLVKCDNCNIMVSVRGAFLEPE